MESERIFKSVVWLIVAFLLVREFFSYLKGKSSERWRRHTGTVIDVKVDVDKYRDADEGLGGEAHYSMPFVRYKYLYAGRVFKSKRMALNDNWSPDYGESSEAVVGINPGSEITIYVNPKNPKQSVLSKGYKVNDIKVLFVVFLFALFSIFI